MAKSEKTGQLNTFSNNFYTCLCKLASAVASTLGLRDRVHVDRISKGNPSTYKPVVHVSLRDRVDLVTHGHMNQRAPTASAVPCM